MKHFTKKKNEKFGYTFKPCAMYYKFIGDEFRNKDQFDKAIEVYNLGLEIESVNTKIYFNLADTYDKKGQYDEA